MAQPQVAPYGTWKSPLISGMIAAGKTGLGDIVLDGADIYWIERRPLEGGRNVIVRRTPDGNTTDMLPLPYNARTRVHEYGGGSYSVSDGTIYFSNFTDQRLYRLVPGSLPQPLRTGVIRTGVMHHAPEENMRYADAIVDRQLKRIICVREDHTLPSHEPINTLVSIPLDGSGESQVLVSGNDFYSSPCFSPDGIHLAWLTWNHPNMPWNGTELWVGEIGEDGSLLQAERIAGSSDESIFQPAWSPDGILHFVSDRTDWWNLYCLRNGNIVPLYAMAAEFGMAQWQFGMSSYAFASPTSIICSYVEGGSAHLARLDTTTGKLTRLEPSYSRIEWVRTTPAYSVFMYSTPTEPLAVARLDLDTLQTQILRRSSNISLDAAYLSMPQPIEFPTEHGLTTYAFFYPPKNRDYVAPPGELPPLLVESHGGPTAATSSELNLEIQYWTSHGIAVLDVNYGGSTGYGRPYRQRLEGQWGIVDVDDCVNGARYLVKRGLVDPNRLMIRGQSAGGYTTLCALTFRNVFQAGASHFGISDQEVLMEDSHKFESRYNDRLIGPYPERRDLYYERSPIHFVDRLSCPIIFFQGLEDKVVPPNQAELMVEALRAKGLPVAYVAFEGEQHGFRRAENIQRALDAELYFYSRVFGFPLADEVEPVAIENL